VVATPIRKDAEGEIVYVKLKDRDGGDIFTPDREEVLCNAKLMVKPGEGGNVFQIRNWDFNERTEFYRLAGVFKAGAKISTDMRQLSIDITPEQLRFALKHGVMSAPFPMTDEEIGKQDGSLLEAVYGLVLEWNMPPPSRSSVSQLPSIHRMLEGSQGTR